MAERRTGRKARIGAALVAAAACCTLAAPASAQLLGGGGGLPVAGPLLQQVPSTLGRTSRGVDIVLQRGTTTVGQVVRDVVGRPPEAHALDRAPDGARIVRDQILVIAPSPQALAIARNLGFAVLRQDNLSALELTSAVLRVPEGLNAAAALAALRKADPAGQYDYNHIYDPSGAGSVAQHGPLVAGSTGGAAMIGMIDGGIDTSHPVFADARIVRRTFAGDKTGPATAHGTAVASLLIGQGDDFHGALGGTMLYAADVYGGEAAGGSAEDIVRALAWLASKGVPVVNVSLAGPANALLGAATKAFLARGHVMVAAVGNQGPAAPALYPAAYPGVVGVTAVDAAHQVQIDANQGVDVAFAARGVAVRAATLKRHYLRETGTSFAAPIVAARFALLMPHADVTLAARAWQKLEHDAVDLGAPGRDPVYGYGYLDRPGAALVARARTAN